MSSARQAAVSVADKASKSGAKTLIITGFASMFRRDELLRHRYLLKPLRSDELLREIERILRQPRLADVPQLED